MDIVSALNAFKQSTQVKYGQNFDPCTTVKNMIGQNCNTPQQALAFLLQSGKINQQQYDNFIKFI